MPEKTTASEKASKAAATLAATNVVTISKSREFAALYKPLLPFIIGLVCARTGLIAANYGSYTKTDDGIFTDGSMLCALLVLAVLLAVLIARKEKLSDALVKKLAVLCISAETLLIIVAAALSAVTEDTLEQDFLVSIGITFFASGAIFYWLRRAVGAYQATAVVFTFCALIASEVVLWLYTFIPAPFTLVVAALVVLAQFPCMRWSNAVKQPSDIASPTRSVGFFGATKTLVEDKKFLTYTAMGIGLLSIVIGLLRGYPSGAAIPFTLVTRLSYGLLTIVVSAALIYAAIHGRKRTMTVTVWVVMQLLACLALIMYAAFPENLEVGAVFTTTLNAIMVGFTWYIVIAFATYGWRDSYFYAISGWLVWLGCRALARMALVFVYPLSAADLAINAIMGTLVVISAQVVFVQFLSIVHVERFKDAKTLEEADAAEPLTPTDKTLSRLMGLDTGESLAKIRLASMKHNAAELGKQFMLSEREVEVLSLYALGYTQKRVAEELYIAPGTAHAHIKRIYEKTGMHSRQEILDYMGQYTS